jgi:hypothetical protein
MMACFSPEPEQGHTFSPLGKNGHGVIAGRLEMSRGCASDHFAWAFKNGAALHGWNVARTASRGPPRGEAPIGVALPRMEPPECPLVEWGVAIVGRDDDRVPCGFIGLGLAR